MLHEQARERLGAITRSELSAAWGANDATDIRVLESSKIADMLSSFERSNVLSATVVTVNC